MLDLEQELYSKRQKIYPREVHGLFAYLRLAGVVGLLGIYFATPWLSWNNRQAVLFDLKVQKFHVFGLTFWPQDLYYLCALLIIAGLSLFLFTALAGRLWCGYSCPQTVWTEVFLWVERRIEGSRLRQMQLDRSVLTLNKLWRKFTKHSIWIIISVWTAISFTGYFTPIQDLTVNLLRFNAHPWASFWVLFFTVATYVNAGWLREQICVYMCPYARFQSAMFDSDTLVISYDPARGEPRGSRRRNTDHRAAGLGDCIDCKMCVQVCPTGIDIREGLQFECIGCAACIDACNDVMHKMKYPSGLIRYTTENDLQNKRRRIIRPRIAAYTVVLVTLTTVVGYGMMNKSLVDLDVIRDRNVLYRTSVGGMIDNVYTLRILNKDSSEHRYQIQIEGIEDAVLLVDSSDVLVPAGGISDATVTIRAPATSGTEKNKELEFILTDLNSADISTREKARFIIP